MKSLLKSCSYGLLITLLLVTSKLATADYLISYSEPKVSENKNAYTLLKQAQFLEKIVQYQYSGLNLPKSVLFMSKDCGQANAFYDPTHHHIVLCYELVNVLINHSLSQKMEPVELVKKMTGILMFTLYHEMGHAVIDILNLPVLGREEDAADQFAVLSFLEAKNRGDKNSRELNKELFSHAVAWFAIMDGEGKYKFGQLADEHSLGGQRFFNALCLIYADDPAANTRFIGALKNRANRCPSELEKAQKSWNRLLGAYNRI